MIIERKERTLTESKINEYYANRGLVFKLKDDAIEELKKNKYSPEGSIYRNKNGRIARITKLINKKVVSESHRIEIDKTTDKEVIIDEYVFGNPYVIGWLITYQHIYDPVNCERLKLSAPMKFNPCKYIV